MPLPKGALRFAGLILVLTAGLSAVAGTVAPHLRDGTASAGASGTAGRDKLFKNHYELITLAKLRGEKTAVVLVAAYTGQISAAAAEVKRLGGEVHFQADEVDYLRARVPVDQIQALAASSSVQSLDIDVDPDKFAPSPDFPADDREFPSSVPPDPDTPLSHPYLPGRDMDITSFHATHPTFDGRGVTLAILDATPDFLLPELQSATSLDGQPIQKIANLLASTDPRDDDDPMWVKMDTQVHADGGKFAAQGVDYIAPGDGDYRFGFFDERALNAPAYIHKDVNFDRNPEGSSGLFAVIWDEKTNTVWVDTDQDHNFLNEHALQDYAIHHDVGIFGTNKPASARRKSVGFVIQTDPDKKYVRVTLGIWQHVTEVSGAAVGKGFYGGSYGGVAPEAQLETIFYAPDIFRLVESTIMAARAKNIDVICLEPSILDEVNNPVHDGTLVAGTIFTRLRDKYQKLILSPANNSAGMTTVVDEVSSRGVIAVGAYQSAESYRINNGATVANYDNLHLVGSFGPAGNGALKPEIISPSEIISTDPGYKPAKIEKGVYEIPPGYDIAGGTSTAGPTASAAVALLISAAKQSNIHYDAGRLKTALLSTARFLPSFPAYKQGNGLVQVGAAWAMLQELDKKYDPLAIESHAPVKTELAQYLNPPFEGPGVFEREGWVPQQSATRSITFKRTSGPSSPETFRLEWVGDNGAFQSADSITLPLNTPVELPISIHVGDPGVYSAILNLKRAGYPGIAYQVLNTIVAADSFDQANHFSVEKKVLAERPGTPSFFYRVPPDTPALRVHLSIPDKKPTLRVNVIPPDLSTRIKWDIVGDTEKGELDRVILNPTPGVWELILWDNNFVFQPEQLDSTPLAPVPADLTLSALGVAASPETWQINPKPSDAQYSKEIRFTNRLAPFSGKSVSFSLGSSASGHSSIKQGEQQTYDIQVPAGADMLRANLTSTSDPNADLDLYVFQILKGTALLQAKSDSSSSKESVVIDKPGAGEWKVVINAFRVPGGSVDYTYDDAFFHPAFGTVTVDDKTDSRANAAVWNVTATARVLATPAADRFLTGLVPVVPVTKDNEPVPVPLPSFLGGGAPTAGEASVGSSQIRFKHE
jgi:hypothetical protein